MSNSTHIQGCKVSDNSYQRMAELSLAEKLSRDDRQVLRRLRSLVALCPGCQAEYQGVYLAQQRAKENFQRSEAEEDEAVARLALGLA